MFYFKDSNQLILTINVMGIKTSMNSTFYTNNKIFVSDYQSPHSDLIHVDGNRLLVIFLKLSDLFITSLLYS